MSREIQIVATSSSSKYLLFGFDAGQTGTFSIQMYLEKSGARAIDFLNQLSLGFVSFVGGDVYIHNSDDVPRLQMFGEAKECKVGVVINEGGGVKKILDSLSLGTDSDEWEVESIVIPPDKNYPNGMYSKIPASFFQKEEGRTYSEFMRNMKTSSSTVKAIEAITGEELRGSSAYMILKNASRDKVQLWEIQVNMTKSR